MNKSSHPPLNNETPPPWERVALRLLQKGLPICSRPFAGVAEAAGCSEKDVLALLQRMQRQGMLRRFGAILNHRQAGFSHNALVAWDVRDLARELRMQLGQIASECTFVSHCYLRAPVTEPGTAERPVWPYQLYAMLHARSRDMLEMHIEALQKALQAAARGCLKKPLVLRTLHEYKKTGMHYFS
ncbi:MAG: Lrp/AsnC family transcriptional regulator [Desulfovibrionaceae bacterium]|nr:Lrp/AsnC family transcriptional regulator [Desulfovibrionaceae bacterium]